MFVRLFLLFTLIPLAELWLLLRFSKLTNPVVTILVVIATGIIGAGLARWQGWMVWQKIQEQSRRGETPTTALLDGLMILIAGALLITPGLLTDTFGFLLLVPPFRALLRRQMAAWLKARTVAQFQAFHAQSTSGQSETAESTVIDVEFTRHPDDENDRIPPGLE